jgi:hypothetical protein
MKSTKSVAAVTFVAVLAGACGGGTPASPSSGAVVTFSVGSETFRILAATSQQIDAARAAQNGGSARIPLGRIVAGTQVNTGWSWHIEDLTFAEVTIELCDGKPSDVERAGTGFGGGRFCPWSAKVIRIE